MKHRRKNKEAGFSLVELMVAMVVMLVLLGLVSSLFARVMGTRQRESRRTDALTSAQAALNVMSREIANAGYGLNTNGIITTDSNDRRIHFRSNIINTDLTTTSPGAQTRRHLRFRSSLIISAKSLTNITIISAAVRHLRRRKLSRPVIPEELELPSS